MIDTFEIFDDVSRQMERLKAAGHAPILVKMSEMTAECLADTIGIKGDLKRFMDVNVSIDNSFRFGTVRVLGAYK